MLGWKNVYVCNMSTDSDENGVKAIFLNGSSQMEKEVSHYLKSLKKVKAGMLKMKFLV